MTKAAKAFLKSTTANLDAVLASLTPEEQHDLLDALAKVTEELAECVSLVGPIKKNLSRKSQSRKLHHSAVHSINPVLSYRQLLMKQFLRPALVGM